MAASARQRSCATSLHGSITRYGMLRAAIGMHPGFAFYRAHATNRHIPVMRLDPV
jgi:hypothetical protein